MVIGVRLAVQKSRGQPRFGNFGDWVMSLTTTTHLISHATPSSPVTPDARERRAWPRSQIQHGMLRAHMRERERRAWPRPLIWYNVRSIVCARLSLSLSVAPHPKKISKHAPQKKQEVFAYGGGAGCGSHVAQQEAGGARKSFAYLSFIHISPCRTIEEESSLRAPTL